MGAKITSHAIMTVLLQREPDCSLILQILDNRTTVNRTDDDEIENVVRQRSNRAGRSRAYLILYVNGFNQSDT